jgi:hypothetical protein
VNSDNRIKILKTLFFTEDEKKFILNSKFKKFKKKSNNLFFEITNDYYYLAYYSILFKEEKFKNYNLIGIWTNCIQTQKKSNFLYYAVRRIYQLIFNFFLKRKWIKLYRAIGLCRAIVLDKDDFFLFTNKNKNKFKNKFDVFKIKKLKIVIGDLIYDTYLRFRDRPTLSLNDSFFQYLIQKSNRILLKLEWIYNEYKPKYYFTGYTSYLQHGLPTRFFINKGINVYSGKNNSQLNKKLSKNDYKHIENYKEFLINFKKKKDKKNLIKIAKNKIRERFEGKGKIKKHNNYLKIDPFKLDSKLESKYEKKLKNIKGVIFFQDFFDSPHDWGEIIFPDFYEWIVYSLTIIRKYNLPIAIKPHPNSYYFSSSTKALVDRLMERYNNLLWLTPKLNNNFIFKNIEFGISASGSVLFDLAMNNKIAISCGEHPGKYYNFSKNINSIKQYRNILLNCNKLRKKKINKKNLFAFYYMYYLNQNNHLKIKNNDFMLKFKSEIYSFKKIKGIYD